MKKKKYFVIDFDSTFTQVEALDELCEICYHDEVERNEKLKEIQRITNLGMGGKMSLDESLERRIKLLKANKRKIELLIVRLKTKVSHSFHRNKKFLQQHADEIFIISNGFREFIVPIVLEYGIHAENIFANNFIYDEEDTIIGYDKKNVLSVNGGKAEQLRALNLDGEVYVIGDGYTDYEIMESGLATQFFAFTENVERELVMAKADNVAPSLDEFLFVNKLPMSISYPKNRIKVLVLENIHDEALNIFRKEGYQIEVLKESLGEDELCKKIKDVTLLCIRSKTHITPRVLEQANRLMAIGAFCIGTNHVDLEGCLKKGIVVFNAPFSNTRSVVELALGEMILLARNIPDKSEKLHRGVWDKSAKGASEIRGKNLGIIGYGNIGSQLSVLAESLGMNVFYYDVEEKLALGNTKRCKTLEELLALADIVTLHVDGRQENKHLIGEKEFREMKEGVVFLNLSRGQVVDLKALVSNLKSGKVRGAAADVFPDEPKNNEEEFVSALRGLPNVILTPHIGGSTEEAQYNIANYVPNKIMDYVNTGSTSNSVNFPNLQLPTQKDSHRLIHIHHNVPGILASINNVFAKHSINILGQYLKTNETIGYVITDINKEYSKEVFTELKAIPATIKFRVLY